MAFCFSLSPFLVDTEVAATAVALVFMLPTALEVVPKAAEPDIVR
jgi:hypothetical protein